MQARILALYAAYGDYIARLVPVHVEDDYLKLVIYFSDGSNLRVAGEWGSGALSSYSDFWLSAERRLEDVMRVILAQMNAPVQA